MVNRLSLRHGGDRAKLARCQLGPSLYRVCGMIPPLCPGAVKEVSPMQLYSVHCTASGKDPHTGGRIVRWLVMPVRALDYREATRDPSVIEMLARLCDGMHAPIVIQRQSYLELGANQ